MLLSLQDPGRFISQYFDSCRLLVNEFNVLISKDLRMTSVALTNLRALLKCDRPIF